MNESTSSTNDEPLDFVGLGPVEFPVYSSEEYWGREVPYAVFILIFCVFFIILQILVMRVMITDRDLKKLPAFQIMFMISFFDTIQLFVHLTAVFYILNSKPHFNLPDYLIGAVMNASWVSMLILSIFLNINRLISIVFHFQSSKIFSPFTMKIYFSLILVVWCIVCFLNSSGFSRMVYLLPAYTWHYAVSRTSANPLSAFVRTASANISLVDVLFSLFAHISIFSWIYFKAALLSRKELILTIQVVCVSAFHVLGYLTWEYFPIPWDLPIGVFIGHVVWMVWNAINPMLYVLINPRIRSLVLASIGKQAEASGRTLFVASHASTVRQSGTKL